MFRSLLYLSLGLLLLAACSQASTTAVPTAQIDLPAFVALDGQLLRDEPPGLLQPGDTAPDFSFVLDGTTQRLSDLRGKRVIVNFWATWCGPCEAEMPALQAAADTSEDLVILGVNRIETAAAIAEFANRVGVSFPLVVDEDFDIGERYGARVLPMSFFIDRNGIISDVHAGVIDAEFINERLGAMQ